MTNVRKKIVEMLRVKRDEHPCANGVKVVELQIDVSVPDTAGYSTLTVLNGPNQGNEVLVSDFPVEAAYFYEKEEKSNHAKLAPAS